MKTGFVLFENYHQRKTIGSSRIRGRWVMKYMQNAENFVQGRKYDAIVFQKAYWKEMAKEFDGVKILDICDPDWLDGAEVVSFSQYMDAITVPTQLLKEELQRMTNKRVEVIPDREDLSILPKPKQHCGKAKKVVWYGYNRNLETLEGTFEIIKKLGLTLVVITDSHLTTSLCEVENVTWDEKTVDEEIQKADFALLPDNLSGRGKYKSNNKTVHAWALGLPVAKTKNDMIRFLEEEERIKESTERLEQVRKDYDVKISAQQMDNLVNDIWKSKSKTGEN